MPRYSDRDRDSSTTRLYVGHLSSRTRTYDLEDLFNRYGRVRDVDMKRDYAFVEFSDSRDAGDARHSLNGRDVDGSRIVVEFARGAPRGPGSSRDFGGRGPPPGAGRCFNCGLDGHWARDCKAGDWKNKCYRCGGRDHIERNCQNSPKKLRRGRSYSRSLSPRRRSSSPRRGRSRSRSLSRSHSYRSSPKRDRAVEHADRSRSPRASRSPKRRRGSPVSSRGRKRTRSPRGDRSPRGRGSPSPRDDDRSPRDRDSTSPRDERSPQGRDSLSPRDERLTNGSDYDDGSPRKRSRSPLSEAGRESPRSPTENGGDHSLSASPVGKSGRDDDDVEDDASASPKGSE